MLQVVASAAHWKLLPAYLLGIILLAAGLWLLARIICPWCKRDFGPSPDDKERHIICPDCKAVEMQKVEELIRAREEQHEESDSAGRSERGR